MALLPRNFPEFSRRFHFCHSTFPIFRAMFYAISCFLLWGLFPLYFKLLQDVGSFDIVLQRIFWSLLFLIVVLTWKRQWAWLGEVARKPRVLLGFLVSALLLSGNWVLYVWAVNADRIVDASLGY